MSPQLIRFSKHANGCKSVRIAATELKFDLVLAESDPQHKVLNDCKVQ